MNKKLFKKLNEQVEINNLKRVELTESEKKAVETKVIFENFTQETEDLLRVENSNDNDIVDITTLTENSVPEILEESVKGFFLKKAVKHMKENQLDKLTNKIFSKMEKDHEKEVVMLKKQYSKASVEKKREFISKCIDDIKAKKPEEFNKMEKKISEKVEKEKTLTEGLSDYFTPERGKVAAFGLVYFIVGMAINVLLIFLGSHICLLLIPAWVSFAKAIFGSQESVENHFINNNH